MRLLASCEADEVLAKIIVAVLDKADKVSLMSLQKASITEDFCSR